MSVAADWPERLRLAQQVTQCTPNGEARARVRFGDELEDWGADRGPCHDCAAVKGEFHVPGCDVERCPECGGQIHACECDWPDLDEGV
ncbi:MAG: hypothetical protein IPJ78_15760 [Gemmatimonadetes bacterium]|nr:hypothetical protein [Gemmatimonadota bacterium]MBP7550296.1 hypothetical protein [Gemmatimonadaceae bacterium]